MRKGSKEKQMYVEIVNELVKYANEDVARFNLNLKPGTYTATSISKLLGKGVCVSKSSRRIQTDQLSMTVPDGNVFYQIKTFEKLAGMNGTKAHKWTINDKRTPTVSCSISFPNKRVMKSLARLMKSKSKENLEVPVLSLCDGCIRSIVKVCDTCRLPTRVKTITHIFDSPQEFQHLSFKIDAAHLVYLYGDCKLTIYKNLEGSLSSYTNPYNIRIVIENADGWSISSNEVIPLSKEYLEIYDAQLPTDYDTDTARECSSSVVKSNSVVEAELHDRDLVQDAVTASALTHEGPTPEISAYTASEATVMPEVQIDSQATRNVATTDAHISFRDENSLFSLCKGFYIISRQPENKLAATTTRYVETFMFPFRPDNYMPDDFRILSHLTPPPLTQPSVYPLSEKRVHIPMCSRMYIEHSVKNLLKSRMNNEYPYL